MTVQQLGTSEDITINKNGTLYSATPNYIADLEDLLSFSLESKSNLIIDASKLTQNNASVFTSVTLTLGQDLDNDGELDDNEIITSRFLSETTPKQEVLNLDLAAGDYLVELAVAEASDDFELSYFTEFTATTIREEWIEQIGTSSSDNSNGVAIDSNGNVYISGATQGSFDGINPGSNDAWVSKYDIQGNLLWIKQLGTTGNDFSRGVTTDSDGNVYISGATLGNLDGTNAGSYDAWVAKYDTGGNLLWTKQLGSVGSDHSYGVATDNNGNVYISGSTSESLNGTNAGSPGSSDAWVAKYDTGGNLLWTEQLGTSSSDISQGVATDNDGNIYLCGYTFGGFDGTNRGSHDAWVAKYDTGGNLLWTEQLGTSSSDISYGVTTDSKGNVYISGATQGNLDGINAGGYEAWVAKYDTGGNLLWTEQLGTTGNDFSRGVTTDSDGNVYISGTTLGNLDGTNAGGNDAWVAKYDTQGNLLWTKQLGTSNSDISFGIAIDNNNSVYLSGYTDGVFGDSSFGRYDAWVAKISQPSTNKAPYLVNPIADRSNNANELYSLTLHAYTFLDLEDGNNLNYSATLANGSSLPGWLSFDANSRTFSGTPTQEQVLEIQVTATDSAGAKDKDTFELTIEPGLSSEIRGTANQDSLLGTAQDDTILGFGANDSLNGGAGNDSLVGGTGADKLNGNAGNDTLNGGNQQDNLKGGNGNDSLVGGAGNDRLMGDAGADKLNGSAGNDTLNGGNQQDTLIGGLGIDRLSGGTGADIFVLEVNSGKDIIQDFEDGIDLFKLPNGSSVNDFTITMNNNGTNSLIKDNDQNILAILTGIDYSLISEADFI